MPSEGYILPTNLSQALRCFNAADWETSIIDYLASKYGYNVYSGINVFQQGIQCGIAGLAAAIDGLGNAFFATSNSGAEFVNQNLAVAGDTAISGGLYVAGPASLQSLNAGTITCTALNVPTLYRQAALLYTPISLAFPLVRSVADATALYGSSFNLASFMGTTGGGLWCLVWPGFAVRFLAADGTMPCVMDNTSGTDLLYSPVSFSSVGVACSSIDVLYLGAKV